MYDTQPLVSSAGLKIDSHFSEVEEPQDSSQYVYGPKGPLLFLALIFIISTNLFYKIRHKVVWKIGFMSPFLHSLPELPSLIQSFCRETLQNI